jgi:hypothetical protein
MRWRALSLGCLHLSFPLARAIAIGRATEAGLPFDDPQCSRAWLASDNMGWRGPSMSDKNRGRSWGHWRGSAGSPSCHGRAIDQRRTAIRARAGRGGCPGGNGGSPSCHGRAVDQRWTTIRARAGCGGRPGGSAGSPGRHGRAGGQLWASTGSVHRRDRYSS